MASAHTPPEDRFWKYVTVGDDCWLWTGGSNGKYGVFCVDGRRASFRREYAHRFSFEMHRHPIPDGLQINHLCEIPLCVNPAHLEVVTQRENMLYGSHPAARRSRQTKCKRGHPLSGDNVRVVANGTRHCSECGRIKARENMRRRREESQARLAAGDDSHVPHGTSGGYFNYGCRCDRCRAAQRKMDAGRSR